MTPKADEKAGAKILDSCAFVQSVASYALNIGHLERYCGRMLDAISIGSGAALSRLKMSDAPELFTAVDSNRAYLRRWLPWVDATATRLDTESFIEACLQQEADNNGFQSVIRQDGKIAGLIGFHGINRAHYQTSLGYWLGADYQGKGLMTRACEKLIEIVFLDWLLHRVEIRCGVGNHKSAAIPKRLGFSFEGVQRDAEWLYDHFVSLEVYSLLKPEWESSRRNAPASRNAK